jgi:hypothetical protein
LGVFIANACGVISQAFFCFGCEIRREEFEFSHEAEMPRTKTGGGLDRNPRQGRLAVACPNLRRSEPLRELHPALLCLWSLCELVCFWLGRTWGGGVEQIGEGRIGGADGVAHGFVEFLGGLAAWRLGGLVAFLEGGGGFNL